jgi:hypothetical protein
MASKNRIRSIFTNFETIWVQCVGALQLVINLYTFNKN